MGTPLRGERAAPRDETGSDDGTPSRPTLLRVKRLRVLRSPLGSAAQPAPDAEQGVYTTGAHGAHVLICGGAREVASGAAAASDAALTFAPDASVAEERKPGTAAREADLASAACAPCCCCAAWASPATSSPDPSQSNELYAALSRKDFAAATALAERGLGVRYVAGEAGGATALHEAAWESECPPGLVAELLRQGMNPSAQGARIGSALHWACENGQAANAAGKVRLMLEAGADVRARDPRNDTPLHLAVYFQSRVEVLELLVRAGSRCGELDNERLAPFDWALRDDRFADFSPADRARVRALLNDGVSLETLCSVEVPRLGAAASRPLTRFVLADGDGHLRWRVRAFLVPRSGAQPPRW